MGACMSKNENDGDDSNHNIDIVGGNVHVITNTESWDQKLAEARSNEKNNENDGDDSNHNIDIVGGNVHVITNTESWDQKLAEARSNEKNVIANFSASWCGPCKMIAPFYSELSEKYPSLMFLTVDVDELTEFSTSWDIKATPTFFFLRDGQQIDKLVGANKPELQKKITAIVDSEVPSQK